MKVTLINTTDAGGGAPAACMRLLKALELQQVDVKVQVQEKKTGEPRVHSTSNSIIGRLKAKFNFRKTTNLGINLYYLFNLSDSSLWSNLSFCETRTHTISKS